MDELAEIKRARKEMQKKAAADARAWRLPEPMRRAVLAMYSLADYDAEPAVIYLQARRRQHQWPEKSDTDVARLVEDLFAASDSEEFAALQDVSDPLDLNALRVAVKHVEEWKAVAWARSLNSQAGVAPSSESMLERLEESRQQLPEAIRPSPAGTAALKSARARIRRIRQRWRGRFGALPVGEH